MAEAATLYASGEEAISRVIETDGDDAPKFYSQKEFEEFYAIERTVTEIKKRGYRRVSLLLSSACRLVLIFIQIALQFPDDLLHDSVPVFRLLKTNIGPGKDLYVLADTSYGRHALNFHVR